MPTVTDSTTLYTRDFRVGDWWARPALNRLEQGAERVQLEPKSMEVLVDLAEHAGEVRSKRRLLHVVWGDAFVTDDVLTHAVWELRKAFGDDPKEPRYIQTIPRKGYRLVAEVAWPTAEAVFDERFPYRLAKKLGEGAMGVVYKAEDTRLERTVALKFLPRELAADQTAKDRFLREARAAAALDHPHIGVVHDVGEDPNGRMYLAMDFYPGGSLKERLAEGPLPIEEAVELARQMAAGLAAAHNKGIVHRDVKPGNVMLTDDGRAKIVDFGLARGAGDMTLTTLGSTVGTALYMSPEQARGEKIDPRSDIWSLGVTLYEMLSGERPFRGGDIQTVIHAVLTEEPVELSSVASDLPPGLEGIVHRCLEKSPEDRYREAAALAEDLEAILAGRRPVSALGSEASPYPGLAPFTEDRAAFFFGREQEVEALWAKILEQKLLALIGPSGAGKTSFIRAGVVPARPEGWRCLVAKPGSAPFISLGQALAPELAGDPDSLRKLPQCHEAGTALSLLSRWRRRADKGLLVVDQFEELFTLNPTAAQAEFAGLIGRLASDADLHVLLSLRDDFLIHCHDYPPLAPVFQDLTPLKAPQGTALRQAIVEPAASLGYAFEEEALVAEMVAEVEEERGALPLVAFTAARLWERRDRDTRLLTRTAYDEIGGVGGALAQHADATLERIGAERIPIASELFRNLVTAQGTRAARDREELLSVFTDGEARSPGAKRLPPASPRELKGSLAVAGHRDPDFPDDRRREGRALGAPIRKTAAEVLDHLIDARLLTSFEVPPADGEEAGHHRIEIIHESLLSHWPRLVRWQTQDQESAQLRDELRQAAQMWAQHGRSDDLLWTGTAFQEFKLWRQRYPGGLTKSEEAFAQATERYAVRRNKRRRLAVAAVILTLLAVLAVVGVSRQQAVTEAERAEAEARRAEASKLLALGRLELDEYPTGALAYSLASLELFDQAAARLFALEALYRGPVAIQVDEVEQPRRISFSPNGRWLAVSRRDGAIELWSLETGDVRVLRGHSGVVWHAEFGPDSELLVSAGEGDRAVRVWSTATGELLRSLEHEKPTNFHLCELERVIVVITGSMGHGYPHSGAAGDDGLVLQIWPLDGGDPRPIGRLRIHTHSQRLDVDPTCTWMAYGDGRSLRVVALDRLEHGTARTVGLHDAAIWLVTFSPNGEQLASVDTAGQIKLWSLADDSAVPLRILQGQEHAILSLRFDASGSRLATASEDQTVRVWDLTAPPEVEPLVLRSKDALQVMDVAFHPGGRWAASVDYTGGGVELWSLLGRYPRSLSGHTNQVSGLAIAPDGTWMATASWDGAVRVWPLPAMTRGHRIPGVNRFYSIAAHAGGRHILGANNDLFTADLLPIEGGESRRLTGFKGQVWSVAGSPNGRLVAAGGGQNMPEEGVARVWDLDSGEVSVLDAGDARWVSQLHFVADDQLVVASGGGIRLWSLKNRTFRTLREFDTQYVLFALSRDGRYLVSAGYDLDAGEGTGTTWQDLETGTERPLDAYGDQTMALAFGNDERTVIAGDSNGVVRVGPATGEEPHLLLHDRQIWMVAATPDNRWVVVTGGEGTLRLWPMPDINERPFHMLPYEELLVRLSGLTNLRAVEDAESATGYRLEAEPFRGLRSVPTW